MAYHLSMSECLLTFETLVHHFYLKIFSYYIVLFFFSFSYEWSYKSNKKNKDIAFYKISLSLACMHTIELGIKIPVANESYFVVVGVP